MISTTHLALDINQEYQARRCPAVGPVATFLENNLITIVHI